MKGESIGKGKRWGIEALIPRGVVSQTPKSEHSVAWRKGYTDYRFKNKAGCLYLDKQMSQDYDAGFAQAEKDEEDGREWLY